MTLLEQAEGRFAQRFNDVGAGYPVAHGRAEEFDGIRGPVEEQVFLARKVVEDRDARHASLPRDLRDRDGIVATFEEEPVGDLTDSCGSSRAPSLSRSRHCAHSLV